MGQALGDNHAVLARQPAERQNVLPRSFQRHWVLSWGNGIELSIFISSNRNTIIWSWISVCVLCLNWLSKLFPWSAERDVSRVTCLRCLFQCGINNKSFCRKSSPTLCWLKGKPIWKSAGKQQRGDEKKCQLHCVLFFQNIFLLVQIRSIEFTGKSLSFNKNSCRSKDTSTQWLQKRFCAIIYQSPVNSVFIAHLF